MWKNIKRSSGSYRSGLEQSIRECLDQYNIIYGYETDKIKYTIPEVDHYYSPDFVFYKLDGDRMYIETKGQWDAEDRKKHFYIKQSNPEMDLRFVFNNPNAKIRKKAKTTYADVCSGKLRGHSDFIVPYAKVGKFGELPIEWLREIKIDITGRSIDDVIRRKQQ